MDFKQDGLSRARGTRLPQAFLLEPTAHRLLGLCNGVTYTRYNVQTLGTNYRQLSYPRSCCCSVIIREPTSGRPRA